MTAMISLLGLLIACGGGAEKPSAETPEGTPPVEAPAPAPAEEGDDTAKVLKALAVKKPEPRCQDVDQLAKDAMGAYRKIIETEKEPPYVPMRAATCMLSQHPKEAEADALKWVVDPEAVTLTTIALGRLDTLPLESAKKVAAAALAGPHKDLAKARIAKLRTPELKAMAAEAQ